MTQFRIRFGDNDQTVLVPKNSLLSDVARQHGIVLRADCGCAGICGQCKVLVANGTDHVSVEVFACQHRIQNDMTVWIPEKSREHQSAWIVVDSTNMETTGEILSHKPQLELVAVEIPPPTREDARADWERFVGSSPKLSHLQSQVNRELLCFLPDRLRSANWRGNALLLQNRLLDFLPQEECFAPFYAVAIDIGTTTLVAELVTLPAATTIAATNSGTTHSTGNDNNVLSRTVESRTNPQKQFGDDIISRIQHFLETPDSLGILQKVLLDSLAEMIRQLATKAGINLNRIVFLTVSGNTVMQHLFLGLDPRFLGFAPFVPTTAHYPIVPARSLQFPVHPNALVYVLPILGGFVGGDLLAGILSCNLDQPELEPEQTVPSLLIDVGTNGEMVLVTKERILVSATAAGPAFEGARIRHGMIAASGAIDQVDFTHQVTLRTIGQVEPMGICGSGLIDLTAELLRVRLITPTGQLLTQLPASHNTLLPETLKEDLQNRLVLFDGQPAFRLSHPNSPPILFTQKDIRQVQLAAGAIRCGIQLLLQHENITAETIRHLYLAGGFGSFIRPENAQQIGLFPNNILPENIIFCGNTSLAGARALALAHSVQQRAEEVVKRVKHVDLSTLPGFGTVFAESMVFPFLSTPTGR